MNLRHRLCLKKWHLLLLHNQKKSFGNFMMFLWWFCVLTCKWVSSWTIPTDIRVFLWFQKSNDNEMTMIQRFNKHFIPWIANMNWILIKNEDRAFEALDQVLSMKVGNLHYWQSKMTSNNKFLEISYKSSNEFLSFMDFSTFRCLWYTN